MQTIEVPLSWMESGSVNGGVVKRGNEGEGGEIGENR